MSDEEELSNAIEGEDNFDVGGGSGAASGGKSKSGLVKILTWVAGIIIGTIFIVTVVVITIGIIDRGNQSQSFAQASEEYNAKPPLLVFYGNVPEIRGRTSDKVPKSFIISMDFGYSESLAQALAPELTSRLPAITDLIRGYFSGKRAEDLVFENEENLKLQLKEKINRILTNGPIDVVVFLKLDKFDY